MIQLRHPVLYTTFEAAKHKVVGDFKDRIEERSKFNRMRRSNVRVDFVVPQGWEWQFLGKIQTNKRTEVVGGGGKADPGTTGDEIGKFQ